IAGVPARHVRMPGNVHEGVAVAAVEANLINVDLVREGDGLRWLVAYVQRLGRRVIGESKANADRHASRANRDLEGKQVRPAREEICHGSAGRYRVGGLLVKFFTSINGGFHGRDRGAAASMPPEERVAMPKSGKSSR